MPEPSPYIPREIRGRVRGRTIELDGDPGLPEGLVVDLTVVTLRNGEVVISVDVPRIQTPPAIDRGESHFIALKHLVESAQADPENVGSYMLRAYRLGEGREAAAEVVRPLEPHERTTRLGLLAADEDGSES
jgi:hypothetical protein